MTSYRGSGTQYFLICRCTSDILLLEIYSIPNWGVKRTKCTAWKNSNQRNVIPEILKQRTFKIIKKKNTA
jgi:hypothetical protein